MWLGFTANLRDAEIRLRQGSVTARDTDELHPVTVLLLRFCDRRSFTFAGRSPWSPEPEHGVLALDAAEIELPTRDRGNCAPVGCR